MRKAPVLLLLIALILSACATPQAVTTPQVTQQPDAPAATQAPQEQPAQVSTEQPTEVVQEEPTGAPAEPEMGRVLIVVAADDPPGLDPQSTSGLGVDIAFDMYSTLITYAIDYEKETYIEGQFDPEIAESWEVAPDSKSVTFKLNPNARFWNGTPITAEDVRFSVERAIDGAVGWGKTQLSAGAVVSSDQAEVIDEHTIRFNFPDGMNRYSLRNFATISFTIVSKDYILENATSDDPYAAKFLQANPMGSGPYKFESWSPGEAIVLSAWEDYWGDPKPYYAGVNFRLVPDSQTRMLLMQTGEADITTHLSPQDMKELANNPAVKVISIPRNQDILTLRWNPTVEPFDDPKIREAIIRAIPYDTIINDVLYGYGTRVKNLIGVDTYGYKELELFETDLEKARQLVSESKYANGGAKFTIVVPTNFPERVAAAVHIQSALREIGIEMEIEQVPYAAYFDKASNKEVSVNMHAMGPWWNDAMYYAYWMFESNSATNYISYSDPELDEATRAALTVPFEDTATYDELLATAFDETLIADFIAAPLYQTNWTTAVKSDIDNVIYYGWARIKHVYLRPAE